MPRVSVSELKARLARYLRDVRRGEEIEILVRGVPVARLTPLASRPEREERRDRLIRVGVLRPGTGDASAALAVPPLVLPASILQALEEDRGERA